MTNLLIIKINYHIPCLTELNYSSTNLNIKSSFPQMAIVAVCGFFAHKQEIRHSYPSHTPSITSLIWCARQTGYDDGELINLILKIADARADDCFLYAWFFHTLNLECFHLYLTPYIIFLAIIIHVPFFERHQSGYETQLLAFRFF